MQEEGGRRLLLLCKGGWGWVGCLVEQEACDGRFKVQRPFSSLAHSVVPPLLLATQLPDVRLGLALAS